MKYDHDWLKEKYGKDERIEYLFFWGHQPTKYGQIGMSCLSQWYEREFEYDGTTFLTAEHWMMAEKAKLFGDEVILEKILNSNSPKEAKSLGRKVKNFEEKKWKENRERIVKNGNYLKFKQNKDLWEYLHETRDKVLVEASPYDRIWGIGMKKGDKGIENPSNWKGLNLLGYALMEVRDKLRKE